MNGHTAAPIPEVPFGFLPGLAARLLDDPDQLIPTARHTLRIVIGKPGPLLFGLTLGLLPVTLDCISVHAPRDVT